MVVPGWVEVKPEDPNRDEVPPNGLEVVLVVPNNPPLLVLVPKAAGQIKQCKIYIPIKAFPPFTSLTNELL